MPAGDLLQRAALRIIEHAQRGASGDAALLTELHDALRDARVALDEARADAARLRGPAECWANMRGMHRCP